MKQRVKNETALTMIRMPVEL